MKIKHIHSAIAKLLDQLGLEFADVGWIGPETRVEELSILDATDLLESLIDDEQDATSLLEWERQIEKEGAETP